MKREYIDNDVNNGIKYDLKKIFPKEVIDDVIYCDTDSIKLRNYEKHKDIINEYNGYRMVSNDSKLHQNSMT